MSQQTYRANLGAKKFPLLSSDMGGSVIVKAQDQNYIPTLTPKEDTVFDAGIPQIFYAENVMPTSNGFQSVGFRTFVATNGAIAEISETFDLLDSAGNRGLLGVDSTTGKFYVIEQGQTAWTLIDTFAGAIGKHISVAHASGTSYIYIANVGCYVYNFTTNLLVATTLTSLVAANVILLVAISGYLLAFTVDEAAWSSVIDPTDFTPSLATGAGGGGIEGAQGRVVHAVPVFSGAIIFTENNAVSCTFSDNARFPFKFLGIAGSGGLVSSRYCVNTSADNLVYAYTTSGLQAITLKQAKTVAPDITDFLSGEVIETFNTTTNELSQYSIIGLMNKRIAFVADRYLILSYGEGALTHAIVWDVILDQYGKISLSHLSCFEFTLYDQTQWDTPKKSIAFIGVNGKISLVDFTFTASHSGVIFLGKYQYVRSRLLALDHVHVENVALGAEFELFALPSLQGDDFDQVFAGYLAHSGKKGRTYNFDCEGKNITLLGKGTFDLNTLLLTYHVGGAY